MKKATLYLLDGVKTAIKRAAAQRDVSEAEINRPGSGDASRACELLDPLAGDPEQRGGVSLGHPRCGGGADGVAG